MVQKRRKEESHMANTKFVTQTTINDSASLSNTSAFKDFLALIKIGIVNSNFITTFTGLWLALYFGNMGFLENIGTVIYTMLGSSLVVAGSCSVNNYYDRDIDHIMSRTKSRPTVTGKVSGQQALAIGLFLIAVGTGFLFMTTVAAALIGLSGAFFYIVLYTMWSKRRYTLNTVVGSFSGAVPPLIGWAAVDPNLHMVAIVLFLMMFIWQPPHFLAIAMRRCEEYRAAGVPMLPVVHGFAITKRQMIAWVACLLPLPFYLFSLGWPFLVLATALNIGWLVLGLAGYKMKNDVKWATLMFVYSLNYLTILFVSMIIVTLI